MIKIPPSAATNPDPCGLPLSGSVIVVGGYGQVGRQVTLSLALGYPDRIVIAGRDLFRAQASAAAIGRGTRALHLDADHPDRTALTGADVVIACAGHTTSALAQAAISVGAHYADVTADLDVILAVKAMDQLARRKQVSAVVSIGLAPGFTNLLAKAACAELDDVSRVDLLVELGLGETHGRDAVGWILNQLATRRRIRQTGTTGRKHRFSLPNSPSAGIRRDLRTRTVVGHSFSFPEQFTLPRTLSVPTIRSWLTLHPAPAGAILRLASWSGIGARLARPPFRSVLISITQRIRLGPRGASVAATASGTRAGAAAGITLALHASSEVSMTASLAVHIVTALLAQQIPAGAHHIEEITDLASIPPSPAESHAGLVQRSRDV